MTRPAFTLVEIIAATALLSVLAVAMWSWVSATQRIAQQHQDQWRVQQIRFQVLRLLADDAAGALISWQSDLVQNERALATVGDAGGINIQSTHNVFGDRPGWRQLRWYWDADAGALMRQEDQLSPVAVVASQHILLEASFIEESADANSAQQQWYIQWQWRLSPDDPEISRARDVVPRPQHVSQLPQPGQQSSSAVQTSDQSVP